MSARKALAPLTAAAAALLADPEEAEATFIGEKGARGLGEGVLRALEAAKDMVRKGELKRNVHKTTGWSQGTDGKWRYEIDDSSSRVVPGALKEATKTDLDYPVSRLLRHDELFQLYPERPLDDVGVVVGLSDDPLDFGGSYQHDLRQPPARNLDRIILNGGFRRDPDTKNPRSILLHELQHAIQAREGFDLGANPSMFKDELGGPSVRMNMRSNLRGAQDALNILQMSRKPTGSDYSPTSPFADEFFNLYGHELSPHAADFKDYSQQEIERVIREIESEFELKQEPFEQYMRNAGEVEARNVQRRADWGMTQRRDNLPQSSEDRPRVKQTLRSGERPKYAGGGKVWKALSGSKKVWDSILEAQRAAEGYRAAVRDPVTGKVYSGDTHIDAIQSAPSEDVDRLEKFLSQWGDHPGNVAEDVGFLDDKGRFLTRDKLEDLFGVDESHDLERFRSDHGRRPARFGDFMVDPEKKYAGGGKVVSPLRALSEKLGDVGEGFVSALERAIATSRQERMPAEQWQKYLAPGRKTLVEDVPFVLKQDELDYSNLPNLLQADPTASRTASELLEHLKTRPLPEFDERRGATDLIDWSKSIPDDWRGVADELVDRARQAYAEEDAMMGLDEDIVTPLMQTALSNGASPVERRAAFQKLLDGGFEREANEVRRIVTQGNLPGSPTQYEDYTTRGPKQGYEENLTKWTPTSRNRINDERRDIDRRADELRWQINNDQSLSKEQRDALAISEHNLRQHSSRLSASMPEDTGNRPAFESVHFDEAGENLLAHSRASRRSPGVRLIEEIQSDWHQAGRDRGYEPDSDDIRKSHQEVLNAYQKAIKEDAPIEVLNELSDRYNETYELLKKIPDNQVPKAPYQKTYPELEFRKQLLRAIAEGDEYLAWTPGEEQINRYASSLRKVVDELHWERGDDGTIKVVPMKKPISGSEFMPIAVDERLEGLDERLEGLDERSLRNLVGKEMAEQILASQDPKGVLKGDDLRIGGSGMRHFYDSVVPDIARRIAKQYEGEVVDVPIDNSKSLARVENGKLITTPELPKFPALRITPAMREKVRRIGVPLFGGVPAIPLSEIDFDGDGKDYDYARAVSRGITPDDTGHWPSRSELEDDEADALGLPWGSGVLLKGRGHETWPLTEQGEADAGYKIIRKGRRYFSVPVDVDVKGDE